MFIYNYIYNYDLEYNYLHINDIKIDQNMENIICERYFSPKLVLPIWVPQHALQQQFSLLSYKLSYNIIFII